MLILWRNKLLQKWKHPHPSGSGSDFSDHPPLISFCLQFMKWCLYSNMPSGINIKLKTVNKMHKTRKAVTSPTQSCLKHLKEINIWKQRLWERKWTQASVAWRWSGNGWFIARARHEIPLFVWPSSDLECSTLNARLFSFQIKSSVS